MQIKVAMCLMLSACALDSGELPDDDQADVSDPLLRSADFALKPLLAKLDRPFRFCPTPPSTPRDTNDPGVGLDLETAHWLSFASTNVHAHYARFASVLDEMGFGDPGEGEQWLDAARQLVLMREALLRGEVSPIEVAELEQRLFQQAVPGKKLQMFSEGKIENGTFVVGSTQVVWAEHRDLPVILIVFRGTEVATFADFAKDLAIDAQDSLTDLAGWGKAHTGYLRAWNSIGEPILEKIATDGQGKQIWLAGHSLGGGIATVAAADMHGVFAFLGDAYHFAGLYTYGQPRAGDQQFAQAMKAASEGVRAGADAKMGTADDETTGRGFAYVRIRHANDLITQVPVSSAGYRHAGRLLHLLPRSAEFELLGETDLASTTSNKTALLDHDLATAYYPRVKEILDLNPQLAHLCE